MARRLLVFVLVAALAVASVVAFAASVPAPRSAAVQVPSAPVKASAAPYSIYYNYSDFFNVPYGEWWDVRAPLYGDEPVDAWCFNATSIADGLCTPGTGLHPTSQYPYVDWAGSGNANNQGSATAMYAPYRTAISATSVPGYNLSQPVFLPVLNYAAAPGNTLSFRWYMQYLDHANETLVTSTRGCYAGSGGTTNDGYQLWNQIYLTLDNEEAARLFGATVSSNPATIQQWWSQNTLPGCSGSHSQSGPLESSVNSWFANTANGKYDIFNGYDAAYASLYTNITATVVSGGPTGITHVYLEHGAWGSEILLDRWFYWGNATYAGNQGNSSRAQGWWPMENGWWEDVHYSGNLGASTMDFNLTGVLQYHFQEHSAPGPDGCLRQQTGCTEASPSDDTPYWTWGPMLVDYVPSSGRAPYSELDRYTGLNYIKTTPGSGDYGTNTSFDYTPISWPAKTGEWWNFQFPTNASAYYQNPATAPLGTDPIKTGQLPTISSTLSLQQIFPAGYGTWNGPAGTWTVVGGSSEKWPPGTPGGGYPYIPYPGIYLQPSNIPPGVTTDPASSISGTAATLNGDLTSLGSAYNATVGFLWGTSPSLAGATNVSVGTLGAPGPFSHGLTGLTLGATYYFEAWALGVSFVHGSILNFNTAATPPSVSTLLATGVGPTNATLNGDLTGLGTAASVTVGFLWGTSPTLSGATNVTVGAMTAPGTFLDALSGLSPGTVYYARAWADGDGFATGTITNFTTPTTYPTVVTDPASAVITTGANLNGHTVSLGTAPSVTVGFLWGTSPALAGATNVTVGTQTAPGAFNEALTGLTPGTTYYFEAWADGNGFSTGLIDSFTTGATAPSVVTDPAIVLTPTAAALNGHTTNLGSAASVEVGFLWSNSSSLAGATNVSVTSQTAPGAFVYNLSGLTTGTTYYFEAWANGTGFATGSILSFVPTATPPTVATDPASSVTTATATLNGNLTALGTAPSVGVGFYWGTSPTLTGATNVTVTTLTAPGTFAHALLGLTPGTTYYFEAWASGDGFAHGSILSFTAAVTPPAVVTDAATGTTTSGATLNGHTTSLGTAGAVDVGFLWGTSSTLAGATNVTVGAQTAPAAFSHALTGLTPGTTYYFEAWARGDGFATGSIMSFATGTTPPTVQTNTATGLSGTGATLNGDVTSLGSATGVSIGFLWGTSSSLAGATNHTVGSIGVIGAFTYGVTGLTPATTYYFEAWANGDGFAAGSIVSFTTGPAVPPSVSTAAATQLSTSGATLNGNLGSLGTSGSVPVGFLWGTSSTLAGATNASGGSMINSGTFSVILTGLTPATTYYFEAWANGDGFVHGTILSFTTTALVSPPSVTSAAATSVNSTGATLNGNLAGLGSASSVSVGFLWGTSSTLAGAANVTVGTRTGTGAFTTILSGLAPSTTYYFEAWTAGAGFAHGTILSFTTPAGTSAPPEPTFLGLPAIIGYAVLLVIIVAIVGVIVAVLMMRRRRKTPPESPPESPPETS